MYFPSNNIENIISNVISRNKIELLCQISLILGQCDMNLTKFYGTRHETGRSLRRKVRFTGLTDVMSMLTSICDHLTCSLNRLIVQKARENNKVSKKMKPVKNGSTDVIFKITNT